MRLSASVVILVASAALGCAKVAVFPDAVPLSKRQDLSPGSPLYDCHADCGKLASSNFSMMLISITDSLVARWRYRGRPH